MRSWALRFFLIGSLFSLAYAEAAPAGWVMEGDVVSMTGPWARTASAVRDQKSWGTNCREAVAKVLCLVEGSHNGANNLDRPCLPETSNYVPAFETLYDRFPPLLRQMFCSLEKLYIEKDLDSTAYALRGAPIIGIRASLLDLEVGLTAWSTWKEQLSFGGSLTSYATKTDLPTFEGEGVPGENNLLYSVIAHEFGHLFDFANNLNGSSFGGLSEGTWGALSWSSFSTPKKGNDFSDRANMCFYNCFGETLSRQTVPKLYGELYAKTNFLNTYTARNPWEDWADSFSFYLLFKHVHVSYALHTQQGEVYDLREAMHRGLYAPKLKYIESFVARHDIKYP